MIALAGSDNAADSAKRQGICVGNQMTAGERNRYREQMQVRSTQRGIPPEVTTD